MDGDTLNLNEDEDRYLSYDEAMHQNQDGHTPEQNADDGHTPEQNADDLQVDSTSVAESSRRPRGKKRRHSKCWKNFEIGEKLSDGTTRVVCKHCHESYCFDLSNGTNTLWRHTKHCSVTPDSPDPGFTPGGSKKKFDILVFREMIAGAIVEHDLTYSFVEYRRIREAFEYANPSIKFWCRNTAVSDVMKIYETEKAHLRSVLSEVPGRVCLTTDLWRAITVEGYMCLTAHYVEAWKLKAKILSFVAFPPPHTGFTIAKKVMELVKEWGLEKKIFTVTVDSASSNDNMQGVLRCDSHLGKDLVCNGEFLHVRCAAHILNLIVQDGLAVITEALEKIRQSVKFVKSSQSREQMFETCVETAGSKKEPALVLDVITRWNSTYRMLDRALPHKEALRILSDADPSYKYFPSDLEWSRGALIKELLSPFAVMTNLVSGSSYPTANLYFMEVWKIECWLRAHETSDDEIICEMVQTMKLKFDKYWRDYSDILSIAAVLDPRLKFAALEYCYDTLDPLTSKSKVDNIRKKMKKLYGVYKKNRSSTTASPSETQILSNIPAGYGDFYAYFSSKTGTGKSLLDVYLAEPVLDMAVHMNIDVLRYWKNNATRFKELARMATDVLSIPITTVSSESSFSAGSRVLSKYRSRLLPSNVQALICGRNWLSGFEATSDSEEEEEEKEEKNERGRKKKK